MYPTSSILRLGLIVLLLPCFLLAQAQRLTDSTRLSLITCAPGEELFSKFGHSAIRAYDPVTSTDVVFNYGLFDFDTPNFYTKFIRGKLKYLLGVQNTQDFIRVYQYEGREITEQPLLLSTEQRSRVVDYLLTNYRPENRAYLYDFFYDNCATRIRDIIEEEFDTRLAPAVAYETDKTFRQLLDEYIGPFPWADFGIDLILGLPADRVAGFSDEMFLPDYLSAHFAQAQLNGANLTPVPVVIAEGRVDYLKPSKNPTPLLVWSVLAVIALILTRWGSDALRSIFDTLFFIILGLAGALFVFMWAGTDHQATWRNFNLLWANPLWLLAVGVVFRPAQWSRLALWGAAGLSALTLVGFPFWPQQLHPAIIPLIIIALLRAADRLGTGNWFRTKTTVI